MKIMRAAGTVDTTLSLVERLINFVPVVLGTAGMTGLSAWAASASHSVAALGPIAWVGAGIVGGLTFLFAYWMWTKIRMQVVRLTLARGLADRTDTINTLDDVFTKRRILLDHFKKPFVEPVNNKTFVDCELVGPAVVYFGGSTTMNGVGFISCDFVAVREDVLVQNVIPFMNTTVRGGRIYQTTILVPHSSVASFPQGAHWITQVPAPQVQAVA